MTTSSTVGTPDAPLSLSQLSEVLMRKDKTPHGIFVSQALWDEISCRFRKEASDPLAPTPSSFWGLQIAIDPNMPDASFDVAFTAEAWSKRLLELRRL